MSCQRSVWSSLALILFIPLTHSVLAATAETRPVTDEVLRLQVLRAIFPGMEIARLPLQPVKHVLQTTTPSSSPYQIVATDAFADDTAYTVRGRATNGIEECASEDVVTRQRSLIREVKFRVFPARASVGRSFVVVAQYRFLGIESVAGACWSIGMAVRVRGFESSGYEVQGRYLFQPWHHGGIASIRMIDLDGEGNNYLAVDSDWGGAGVAGSSFYIFDLRQAHFGPVLIGLSSIEGGEEEQLATATIDISRTRLKRARSFCFVRRTMIEAGHPLPTPRIYRPS